jgi:hypothetical protein
VGCVAGISKKDPNAQFVAHRRFICSERRTHDARRRSQFLTELQHAGNQVLTPTHPEAPKDLRNQPSDAPFAKQTFRRMLGGLPLHHLESQGKGNGAAENEAKRPTDRPTERGYAYTTATTTTTTTTTNKKNPENGQATTPVAVPAALGEGNSRFYGFVRVGNTRAAAAAAAAAADAAAAVDAAAAAAPRATRITTTNPAHAACCCCCCWYCARLNGAWSSGQGTPPRSDVAVRLRRPRTSSSFSSVCPLSTPAPFPRARTRSRVPCLAELDLQNQQGTLVGAAVLLRRPTVTSLHGALSRQPGNRVRAPDGPVGVVPSLSRERKCVCVCVCVCV